MSEFLSFFHKEKQIKLESLLDDFRAKKDRDFFRPFGTQIYCGRQGSGKTISAVRHVLEIKSRYPKSVLVSNLSIKQLNAVTFTTENSLAQATGSFRTTADYVYFQTAEQLSIALVNINNAHMGVIYLIDEIHTYFNALESANIPMFVFTEISQQRKQRKLIIGTSQLFMRLAKPFREQCDNVIICNTMFGIFTIQKAYDGMTLEQDYNGKLQGNKRVTGWFFQTKILRNSYDTYQKVVSANEQYADLQKPLEMSIKAKKGKLKLSN